MIAAVSTANSQISAFGGRAAHRECHQAVALMCFTLRADTSRQVGSGSNSMSPNLCCYGSMELDSHADTCCVGSNHTVIEYLNKECNVIGFNHDDPSAETLHIPIVKAATEYDSPWGEVIIMVIPQALHLGKYLNYSLICSNQLRYHGVVVDDETYRLSPNPALATYSIYIPSEDLENCRWVILTSENDWDPHSPTFSKRENTYNYHGHPVIYDHDILEVISCESVISDDIEHLALIRAFFCDHTFIEALEVSTHVATTNSMKTCLKFGASASMQHNTSSR